MTDIQIEQFYQDYDHLPVIDVRSPGEFDKGHIPGATNIPLFNNDERAHVGTVYKQEGKDEAIAVGYEYVKPKLKSFIEESLSVAPDGKVVVHCWRGGMRSHAFAQHLADNGFTEVYVITGGYKAFRNHVLSTFDKDIDLKVIGGYTGSGKTYILEHLKELGCQVVDLEALACHKGSAFGGLGEKSQPTVEQFENDLFIKWKDLDALSPVYIEDESHSIGSVKIPMNLYTRMRDAIVYFLDIPKEERAKVLVKDYSGFDNQLLEKGIQVISKKLGGLVAQKALEALNNSDYYEVAMLTLNYYDKSYLRGVMKREPEKIVKIELPDANPQQNADKIKNFIEEVVIK